MGKAAAASQVTGAMDLAGRKRDPVFRHRIRYVLLEAVMQCPDCKRLRHFGPCEPWDQEPDDSEQFYRDMEVEMAKEVLRKAAARGQVKENQQ